MIAPLDNDRVVGTNIASEEDAGKRIDVPATAPWNAMTVAEVARMDRSYASPFSPVWDPVLLAAGRAAAESG